MTYDVVSWKDFDETYLDGSDFGPRFEQRLFDLSDRAAFEAQAGELASADMIFLDASKDGFFEERFLSLLFALEPKGPQLIVLDDIRVLTMIRVWRDITLDKLDVSSFGHWSGTGIVVRGGFPPA